MAKFSEELSKKRREEILNAAKKIYDVKPFKEITLKDIGEETSFTRTSIYNYFSGKEEIYLSVLESEFSDWADDIDRIDGSTDFSAALSDTLQSRSRMLKIMSMNLYEVEAGSSTEHLVEFKIAYGRALNSLRSALKRVFPDSSDEWAEEFVYAFLPFLFGVYPYTEVTEKQIVAMQRAGVDCPEFSAPQLAENLIDKLLASGR